MRKPIIAGNWKLHKTGAEAEAFFEKLKKLVPEPKPRVFIAPPLTALSNSYRAAHDSHFVVGAQNVCHAESGAFTGEVSAVMLKEAGAQFAIIGHSERRHIFGESDELVQMKVVRCLQASIFPILCVGETESQRTANKEKEVVAKQLREALRGASKDDFNRIVIAYEPVWAIGTGKTATPEIAQEMHAHIRITLEEMFGFESAESCCILYGGSVKSSNIAELMRQADIDGALVGGAALDAAEFAKIIQYNEGK